MGCGGLFCDGFLRGGVFNGFPAAGEPEAAEYGGEPGPEDAGAGGRESWDLGNDGGACSLSNECQKICGIVHYSQWGSWCD